MTTDLNMTPPPRRARGYVVQEEKKWTLMTRNSGNLVRLDQADFEALKMIPIYEYKGQIVVKNLTTIEAYLGITGEKRIGVDRFDCRRMQYA